MLSLLSLGFVGSLACAQVTFLEKEDCPNHVSEAWGIPSYGWDVSVHGDFALCIGYHPIGLYEYCEGNWKLLWSHVGNDPYDWVHPCGAIGEDYFAYTYQNNSLEYVRICEIADPGVSVVDIPIPTGNAMWGDVELAFIGNDLVLDNGWAYGSSDIYFASSGWTTSQTSLDVAYNSNGNDVDNGRWVNFDVDGLYTVSYDVGEAEYVTDVTEYDFLGEIGEEEELGYWNSFVHEDRVCVSMMLYDPGTTLYRVKLIFFEYDNGDWVYQNEVVENGQLFGRAFMGDRVVLQDYSSDEFFVVSDLTSNWSSHAMDALMTPSNSTKVSAHGGHLLIGEVNGGDPVVYNSTTYYPGTVHFYENYASTAMELLIYADGTSSNATTWEIRDASNAVVVSGPSTAYAGACALRTETFDLPAGSYGLRVTDADNTVCSGGFLLKTAAGDVVLDASSVPAFTSPSQYTTIDNFQIPVGPIEVTNSPLPTSSNTWLVASEDCELQALCEGVGPLNTASTAYQWEYFKPHSAVVTNYWRYVAYYWNGSSGFSAFPGANFCEKVRASKPGALVTSPIPLNQYLNVRIRARVNGVDRAWGPVSTVYYTTAMRPANWRVSPNPITSGNGQLRLEVVTQDEAGIPIIYDSELRMQSLRLLDLSGRVMASKGGLEYSIDAPFFWDISDVKLTTGMYLVEVTTNTGVSATKIMVQ